MDRLLKRAEFLAVARGPRSARRGFVLQALVARPQDAPSGARMGFTVTKKVGNAVVRNRVKRRMREAARLIGERHARAACDYVLIGRREALTLPFEALIKDLEGSFRQVHRAIAPKTADGGRAAEQPGHERPPVKDASSGMDR